MLHPEKNPFIHVLLKKTFYNQFCAGETRAQAKQCVKALKDLGFKGVILTYARETVFDNDSKSGNMQGVEEVEDKEATSSKASFCPSIEEWRVGTLKTIELIAEGDMLALKMTGAGSKVTAAFVAEQTVPQQFLDALDEICAACKARSIRIIVDGESQHFQKGIAATTLQLMNRFNRDGSAIIFNTYQAYLKHTPKVIAEHLEVASQEGFTLGLKLVRGAYMLSDDRSLIHDTKQETDDAYNHITTGALKQQIGEFGQSGSKPFPSVNLFLASHNKQSVIGAHRLHQERIRQGLPTVPVGFAQLHGMSDQVSFQLLSEKDECGVPLKRAVENRDAVLRTTDEFTALKSELWRRIKSGARFVR
ncbi:uncharacterized protein JN550_010977 [Neoarthrinium moseri]|uniref:uncharacterized protein n=1 Tax=Neoarthrinium moseri TaxID=1658444 RepID=UPI001FDCFF5A|nr:uncharacterized protein JN550_010977 [Neoarthrinium moseri]KAI1861298.1 hypothetical protein JN550_010977 [Neoarthrinium moseri]